MFVINPYSLGLPDPVLIPGATGTPIGNATLNAGLAAAFDGTNVKSNLADCACITPVGNGTLYIGKDWGAGNDRIIRKAVLYGGSFNYGFSNVGSGQTLNIKLQGSTDNFSSSVVDLATSTVTNSPSASKTLNPGDIVTTTAYRYHRWQVVETGGAGGHTMGVSQAEFWA